MPTIHEQRNRLQIQEGIYDRRIRNNKNSKSNAEKKIGFFRKKKKESEMMASFYRNKYKRAHKFNEKFSVMKLSVVGAVTGGLKIIQVILGIFSLGSFLNIPVVIMYIILAIATGTKVVSEVSESKNKNNYENEEKTSKTYDLQIDKLEHDIEKYVSEIRGLQEKKSFVTSGLKEIDDYLRNLDVDFEKIREQNLSNEMANVAEVQSRNKVG